MLTIYKFIILFWIFSTLSYSIADLGSCGVSKQFRGAIIGGISLSSAQRGNYPW